MSDEQDATEQATAWLERVTGDPLADAVRGTARVDAVSEVRSRRRFQECRLTVTVEAPGIPPRPLGLEVVVDRRYWPRAGQVLPARISASDPAVVEIVWDALRG